MSGERDFAVAVFLLAAVALLLPRLRSAGRSYGSLFGTGVGAGAGVGAGIGALLGIAVNVKPTVIPAVLLLLAWAGWRLRSRGTPILPVAASVTAGGLLPCAATLLFLLRNHAVGAFVAELRGLIPYHASLAHRSFGFLIGHSISPLLPLCVVWVVALVLLRSNSDPYAERAAIALCAVGGLLSYLLQQKGFAYQRYPFLAFLLVLIAGDFVRLARSRTAARAVGMVGLLAGAVFCTIFLARTATFDRGEPARPLLADLQALGVTQGQVQCMDTAGSCIDNLYAGRIVQSTGFLYDCYLLDGSSPVALDLRRRFWEQIERNPPRWIVVTDSICYDPKPGFDKFGRWPEFSGYLANNYTLARSSGVQRPVRYWSRAVAPFAYRIYVRR